MGAARIGRGVGLTGLWLAATAFGATVVWLGLGPVLDAAVPDRQVPLTTDQVRVLPTSPAPAPTHSLPAIVVNASPRRTSPAGAPAPSPPPPPTPAPSGSPSATPSPVTVDGWTLVGPDTYQRTFTVPGGRAVMRVSPGIAEAVSVTTAAGYTSTTTRNQPDRVVVQFLATGTSDIVDAMWWEGRPFAQVSHL